jgi:ribosomal protein L35
MKRALLQGQKKLERLSSQFQASQLWLNCLKFLKILLSHTNRSHQHCKKSNRDKKNFKNWPLVDVKDQVIKILLII